jgi:hypothetical protein
MTRREKLEALKFELAFLDQGGYGRSPHTPHLPRRLFMDSPTCLNFDDGSRPHPCNECLLMDYVPESKQQQSVPCHHIPLDAKGATIESSFDYSNELVTQDLLRNWLVKTIRELEQEEASAVKTSKTA